ncbi:MAG TPA: RNA methyltransferase [Solirubrobacteraceae bacterium]|jgi:TrmH family RNA methyltransferase|nr:RNA methyltransferase [Solirubrobacteraceae bacterium]
MNHIISSLNNPGLRELRRLHRRRERERSSRFLAEGEDLVAAARLAGRPAVAGFRAADPIPGAEDFIEVEPAVLAEVSSLGSGTRVIGVYEQRFLDAPVGPVCVYLHQLSDPGNVGTILRAAQAFGASCVAFGPGCADPHSPKAVRASMGAIFDVPLAHASRVADLPGERIALVAHAGEPLRELAVKGPLTLLIGAEREGLPRDLVRACERVAHIPIRSESLNAAMAATIALYEMTRVPTA